MTRLLTDLGEEWYGETDISGVASVTLGLYNDSTDAISDTNDLSDISTEPSGASYARQTMEISFEDLSGDWGFDNDNQESFDTSDSSQTVDSYFLVANFQADDTSDGSATDHLIATGALSQSYDLSNVDTLNISAGTAGVTVS